MSQKRMAIVGASLGAIAMSLGAAGAIGAAEDSNGTTKIAASNSSFAADLHRKLASKQGNLFHSPLSISTALAMTAAGARGETADQMAKVLHLDASPATHAAMAELITDLNNRKLKRRWRDDPDAGKKPFELAIANALWGQEGYPFEKSFVDLTQERYGAGMQTLDFRRDTEGARQRINRWVEEKTNDKIKELLKRPDLTPDVRLVLTNAIYFKSAWDNPFNEEATRQEPFHLSHGETATVPIMHQTSHLEHKETADLDVVKLPYKGGQASMVLFIPKSKDGLAAIEADISNEKLAEWLGGMKRSFISLGLPSFKFTSRFVLNKVLQDMGMKDPFAFPQADFTGISATDELYIGLVIHQAYVDVNEAGTEAAAATAVVMRAGGVPPKPTAIQADRPFLFVIRDEQTGTILFMGRMADPRP